MTPNGTVVAYSKPANIKQVRDQAAIVSMVLKDKLMDRIHASKTSISDTLPDYLRALIVELDSHAIIARPLQANLLLVLIGQTVNSLHRQFKITLERTDDAQNQRISAETPEAEAGDSEGSDQSEAALTSTLQLQRSKMDALVDHIHQGLDDLEMPEDVYPKPVE